MEKKKKKKKLTWGSFPDPTSHTFRDISLEPVIIVWQSYVTVKQVIASLWLTDFSDSISMTDQNFKLYMNR